MSLLNQPYPLDDSVASRLKQCLGAGIFVILFLIIFRPFGLYGLPGNYLLFMAGAFGAVTCLALLIHSFLIYPLYTEEGWTVGKELLRILAEVLTIAIGNWWLSWIFKINDLTWTAGLQWFLYTLVIGIWPISFGIFLNYHRLLKRHVRYLEGFAEVDRATNGVEAVNPPLKIIAENGQRVLELDIDSLRYIKSADNYVEVVYYENGQRQKTLLRTSLKQIANSTSDSSWWMRCHNSYILNLRKVTEVKGNAQGYKVMLDQEENPIPVSRKYLKSFGERMKRLH